MRSDLELHGLTCTFGTQIPDMAEILVGLTPGGFNASSDCSRASNSAKGDDMATSSDFTGNGISPEVRAPLAPLKLTRRGVELTRS